MKGIKIALERLGQLAKRYLLKITKDYLQPINEVLTKINIEYGNLIQATATILLVLLTAMYLITVRDQLNIIRQDYTVRSLPAIEILTPKKNKTRHRIDVMNSGFHAENIKIGTVLFSADKPVSVKYPISLIYFIPSIGITQNLTKLITNQTRYFFLDHSEVEQEGKNSILLCWITYDVPLGEKVRTERQAFSYDSNTETWSNLGTKETNNLIKTAIDKGFIIYNPSEGLVLPAQ